MKVIKTSDCNSRDSYSGRVTPAMICAGIYPNGGIDTCQVRKPTQSRNLAINLTFDVTPTFKGDSGGPMVAKVGGNYELVGATSWGRGCAWHSLPGIYADIRRTQKPLLNIGLG